MPSAFDWQRCRDAGAALWRRLDAQLSATERDPLAHSEQPEALVAGGGVEAVAVVLDGDRDCGSGLLDSHPRMRGARMLDDVRQRLLDQAVDRGLELRGKARCLFPAVVGEIEVERDVEATPRSNAVHQDLDRGANAELIQRRRAQLGDQALKAGDDLADLFIRPGKGGLGRLVVVDLKRALLHDIQRS